MGEAKRRGTVDVRAAQAKERKHIPVSEALADLGLPPDSKFVGYVVHNPEKDDFLASLDEQGDVIKRAYIGTPEGALVFDDYAEACRVADGIQKRTIIGTLFDVGSQLVVAFDEK
jgi:hypothetical protein